jgi:ferritin-like metal-binding protein YciE
MAEAMGETEVAELLTKDLEQERAALEKLQSPQGRLG